MANSVAYWIGKRDAIIKLGLASDTEKDRVWRKWKSSVNMTAKELRDWKSNFCSQRASINPNEVIDRNLRLLEKPQFKWDSQDVQDAKRTISFIARMRNARQGQPQPGGCPSKRDISLKNWAFDPDK